MAVRHQQAIYTAGVFLSLFISGVISVDVAPSATEMISRETITITTHVLTTTVTMATSHASDDDPDVTVVIMNASEFNSTHHSTEGPSTDDGSGDQTEMETTQTTPRSGNNHTTTTPAPTYATGRICQNCTHTAFKMCDDTREFNTVQCADGHCWISRETKGAVDYYHRGCKPHLEAKIGTEAMSVISCSDHAHTQCRTVNDRKFCFLCCSTDNCNAHSRLSAAASLNNKHYFSALVVWQFLLAMQAVLP